MNTKELDFESLSPADLDQLGFSIPAAEAEARGYLDADRPDPMDELVSHAVGRNG